ncbi:MAG: hypothetical protein ABL949_14845 [Fimbriimonadaceae bacterium]
MLSFRYPSIKYRHAVVVFIALNTVPYTLLPWLGPLVKVVAGFGLAAVLQSENTDRPPHLGHLAVALLMGVIGSTVFNFCFCGFIFQLFPHGPRAESAFLESFEKWVYFPFMKQLLWCVGGAILARFLQPHIAKRRKTNETP